jgi:hypothetical protein
MADNRIRVGEDSPGMDSRVRCITSSRGHHRKDITRVIGVAVALQEGFAPG